MRVRAAAAAFLLCAAAPAAAQDSAAARDSLLERLERAEQAIERLTREQATQDRSKVGSRLRNHVELSGMVLLNGFFNNAAVNNSDSPTFVLSPQDSSGLANGHAGGQVRQSRIGLSISGARALGAMLSGDIQLDFYGGQPGGSAGRQFPVPRIRTAVIRLDWRKLGLLVGQETQLISPNNPVSLASVGVPGFTHAGNLWFWIPQARLSFQSGGNPRLGLQAAALAPSLATPTFVWTVNAGADDAEKSQRPMVQGRGYVSWSYGETESQIGVGIHRGWIATDGDSTLATEAFSVDARIMFGEKIQLIGEAFIGGRSIAGLGGGGIGQNFGLGGVPVDSRGGWVQLNVRPSFVWEVGGGYGMDDPDDADLGPASRFKNTVIEAHLHHRPGGGLILGAEFRRITTTWLSEENTNNHINAFAGLAF